MTRSSFNKYEFKKYLLERLSDCRQEELIFWKKNIPLPVDLIYDLFDKREILFSKYLNHIGSACLSSHIDRLRGIDWITQLKLQPNAGNKSATVRISHDFKDNLATSGVYNLISDLSEFLFLKNYKPDEHTLVEAFCHEGRKYKRLWLPLVFRVRIATTFPQILDHIALSNWDMFSNVVADELKIYRMGFADAFSGIFNKLIEYTLENSCENTMVVCSPSTFNVIHPKEYGPDNIDIDYGIISDGSLWEPKYISGKIKITLNSRHPFCDEIRRLGSDSEQLFVDFLQVLSAKEYGYLKLSDKRLIENFRHDVSRELRLRSET